MRDCLSMPRTCIPERRLKLVDPVMLKKVIRRDSQSVLLASLFLLVFQQLRETAVVSFREGRENAGDRSHASRESSDFWMMPKDRA